MTDQDDQEWQGRRRGPGRPRGSKNSYRAARTSETAAESLPDDQRIPDLTEMLGDQLRIVRSAQAALKSGGSIRDIVDLSRALESAVKAVERAVHSQEGIIQRMSAAEQVESAIRRLERSSNEVRALAIRRLKEAMEDAPAGPFPAVDAIRRLT